MPTQPEPLSRPEALRAGLAATDFARADGARAKLSHGARLRTAHPARAKGLTGRRGRIECKGARSLDQRSANEGFLFLLFYFTLFVSPETPAFFSIDNVDASLDPKSCAEMTRQLIDLAKQNDKQVLLTTHDPAVLEALEFRL